MEELVVISCRILLIVFVMWLIASPFIVIISILKKRDLDRKPILNIKFFNAYFFFCATFLSFCILFTVGFEKLLFFIPYDFAEGFMAISLNGEVISIRHYIALLLGGALGLLILVECSKEMERIGREENGTGPKKI